MTDAVHDQYREEIISGPMALAAFITSLAGLHAINLVFYDPIFATLTVALLTVGSVVSYLCRVFRLTPNPLELPSITLFLVVGFVVLATNQTLPVISPRDVAALHANRMGLFLAWIIVGLAFAGSSNVRLLFSAIPALAAIGLVSTMSADPLVEWLFLVYVFSASFMLVHENCLRAEAGARARSGKAGPSVLTGQLQIAAACAAAAAVLSNVASPWLHSAGSAFIGTNLPLTVPLARPGTSPNTRILNLANPGVVAVGTGPVTLSNQPVLRVRSPEPAYWRSSTFDQYDGRTWTCTLEPNRVLPVRLLAARVDGDPMRWVYADTHTVAITEINAVPGPSHTLRQTVQFVGGASSTELFGAAEPREIRMQPELQRFSPRSLCRMDDAGRITVTPRARELRYDIDSQIADRTPERLRRCNGPIPETIRRLYLPLDLAPPQAIRRIRDAAVRQTRGARTTYDQVEAIVRYVSSQCAYNTATAAVPSNRDVVDYFLFEAKEGYCDSFASAVAVLCRTIGIPARVASGFISGELDTNSGWYIVRERHRHLWAEVYFPGAGWIPFDATTDAVDKSPPSPSDQRPRATIGDLLFRRGWLPPIAFGAFLCMLGYVLKVEVLDRLLARQRKVRASSLPPSNERIARAYLAACDLLARRGLPRRPDQTPQEYADACAAHLATAQEAYAALTRLTDLVTRYCYSAAVAADRDVAEALSLRRDLAARVHALPRHLGAPGHRPART